MQTVVIEGTTREGFGKKEAKALRKKGLVPCNLYGGSENVSFAADPTVFKGLIYTPDFKLAEVVVNGKSHRAILKEVQFDPVSDEIVHIDLMELVPGRKFKVSIPVNVVGSSPGVKVGGKLVQQVRKVNIKTTPERLVDSLSVDISSLELGKSVRIKDIQPVEGVEVMNAPAIPLAIIEIPRALRAAQAAAKAAAETASKKKKK